MENKLVIKKQDYINSVLNFIKKYKRFPFLDGDKFDIGESSFSANKYMKEFFKTQDSMINYFLDNDLVTSKLISECINLSENKVEDLLSGKNIAPDNHERRAIHIFFEKDFYEKFGKHDALCDKCKKKCKQDYWITYLECPKYDGKKISKT